MSFLKLLDPVRRHEFSAILTKIDRFGSEEIILPRIECEYSVDAELRGSSAYLVIDRIEGPKEVKKETVILDSREAKRVLESIKLPGEGRYRASLLVDGRPVASTEFDFRDIFNQKIGEAAPSSGFWFV
jgi:hypothetical protein